MNDSLVQNCFNDDLHPWSSGFQTHFSAVLKSSAAKKEKQRSGIYLLGGLSSGYLSTF